MSFSMLPPPPPPLPPKQLRREGKYTATYYANHTRLRRARGSASQFKCMHCAENGVNKQAQEWAQVHDTDGIDPYDDYISLCKSCHRRYDKIGHNQTKSIKTRAKMSASAMGHAPSGRGRTCQPGCTCGRHRRNHE